MKSEILTPTEVNSAVWQKLKKHIESKINQKRESNDQPNLDIVKTSNLRGEIKALKELMVAVEPKQYNTGKKHD